MKNWKTTVFGALTGLIPVAQTLLNSIQTGQAIDWAKIAMGAGIALIGYFAKDFSVSGTTTK